MKLLALLFVVGAAVAESDPWLLYNGLNAYPYMNNLYYNNWASPVSTYASYLPYTSAYTTSHIIAKREAESEAEPEADPLLLYNTHPYMTRYMGAYNAMPYLYNNWAMNYAYAPTVATTHHLIGKREAEPEPFFFGRGWGRGWGRRGGYGRRRWGGRRWNRW